MNTLSAIKPDWAWAPFEPDAKHPWNRRAAAHLYRRGGFGAHSKQLDDAVKAGVEGAVKKLLYARQAALPDKASGGRAGGSFEMKTDMLGGMVMAGGSPKSLGAWWLYRMMQTPDQSLEKLALFWHGHFATSAAKVNDAELIKNHDSLLRRHARGSFAELTRGMAKDPAMLIWLDSTTNRKRRPNENFARELMELFCLGVGNYTEDDIREMARAFTGWEVRRGKFIFNARQHDEGSKTFLGKTGAFQGEDAVRIVLEHPAAARFVVRKLTRYLLCDEPALPDALIEPLARLFRKQGLQTAPVVERILRSNLFYSRYAIAQKVRSPVELGIGLLRTLRATANLKELNQWLGQLGQSVYYPPNVKGWDGGRTWINSSTLLARGNLVRHLLSDKETRFHGGGLGELVKSAGVEGADDTVDWLLELLVAPDTQADVRKSLVQLGKTAEGDPDRRIAAVIHAISALPEFQLS